MADPIVSKFFNLWKSNLIKIKNDFRRIISSESFNEIKQEELDEIEYASIMGMDSIYWCWGCKYGDCRISH